MLSSKTIDCKTTFIKLNFPWLFTYYLVHAYVTLRADLDGKWALRVMGEHESCIKPYEWIFILFLYTCMLEYDVLPQKCKKPGWKPSSTTCFEKCSRGVLEASVQSPPDGVETWPKLLEKPPNIFQNKLYWMVFSRVFCVFVVVHHIRACRCMKMI